MTDQERMEQIELPEELDQVILGAVELGKRRENQMRWKRVGLCCAGAAAACAIFVSAGFASPVAAQALEGLPAVGRVFTYLYDLAGYEGRYTQVAEDARPAVPVQSDLGGEPAQAATAEGRQDAQGQQDSEGQQETVQRDVVTASDEGLTITVKEYFCDKQSLYLSLVIESEEPLVESGLEGNTKSYVYLITGEEFLSCEGEEAFSVGSSSLQAEGVFLDEYTFVGIARSEWGNVRAENMELPDQLVYTAPVKHVNVYSAGGTPDFRGEWELSMEILCDGDAVEILPVDAAGEDGSRICEVRLQPYEVQVATESKTAGRTLTEEEKMLIAFDREGNLLDWAGSTLSFREGDREIYEYARPENLQGLELFIVDEGCWMDQWKGRLYDGTSTGPEMVEFLKENCITHVSVDCSK